MARSTDKRIIPSIGAVVRYRYPKYAGCSERTRAMTMSTVNLRRAELEQERLRLQAEINQYPAPIPACDVYFNDLLERRSRVCDELARLAQTEQTR
ncbi:MAG: hypothetical protein JWN13_989 [Betaproteobacteria bacterium]|jgi:hypothetical protein|nr:hypothetical protein [Betaproteobacteria bacterium]